MHDTPSIDIITGAWTQLGLDAARIRDAVFVREQGIPADLEWDEEDARCVHVVAYRTTPEREPVATARLLAGGWIGRVAVIKPARRGGLGRRVVEALVEVARHRGDDAARLYSQTYAVPLYEACGFQVVGEPFEEAGIPHIEMVRAF
ncbi:GNAT family N-acetyltransferase [Pararobbsia silviterrae]|uniref:GNAT family N-acetyltransferase n=1 Tax=Pararobbsia silviterrae TaxID=1792498 RepID=A0A494X0F1_9BURK|nr:GNAT family N-acetyltransferase [Pararobbsia silviterrae]RKP44238.1 GNAT family N-acetyltransferase [Pararobbsia silviterrae]